MLGETEYVLQMGQLIRVQRGSLRVLVVFEDDRTSTCSRRGLSRVLEVRGVGDRDGLRDRSGESRWLHRGLVGLGVVVIIVLIRGLLWGIDLPLAASCLTKDVCWISEAITVVIAGLHCDKIHRGEIFELLETWSVHEAELSALQS